MTTLKHIPVSNFDQGLAKPEETIAKLHEAFGAMAEHLAAFQDLYNRMRSGEPIDHETLNAPLFAIHETAISQVGNSAFTLAVEFTSRVLETQRNEYIDEWLANGKKFTPKTAIECDLWNGFHKFQDKNYSVLVFYSDSLTNTYPIKPLGRGVNVEEALQELKDLEMINLMAVLDLHKSFEEQWPYIPGLTSVPATLINNPVITIPQLTDVKPHPRGSHLRVVPT